MPMLFAIPPVFDHQVRLHTDLQTPQALQHACNILTPYPECILPPMGSVY